LSILQTPDHSGMHASFHISAAEGNKQIYGSRLRHGCYDDGGITVESVI